MLRKVNKIPKAKKLIKRVINELELDLTGKTIMTEVGTGPFFLTPIIADLAGAKKVIAVGRDSSYGNFVDVKGELEHLMSLFKVSGEIVITDDKFCCLKEVDIVTNLSNLRPLDRKFCENLKNDAVIALMFEPWELRKSDIDLEVCKELNIPILGVNEEHERLRIFDYVGILAIKLALESENEILNQKVLILGSGVFGEKTQYYLSKLGALVTYLDVTKKFESLKNYDFDLVVCCEHKTKKNLIGTNGILDDEFFKTNMVDVIHICGNVDVGFLQEYDIKKYPKRNVSYGYMTYTTDYVGIEPVIRLHAGGIKAACDYVDFNKNTDFCIKVELE